MSLLDTLFGGSKQKSSSTQESQGTSVSGSNYQSLSLSDAISRAISNSASQAFNTGDTSSQSVQNIYGPQASLLDMLYGGTGGLFDQYLQNPTQLIAGFDPLQIAGQNAAVDAATGLPINQVNQGFSNLFSPTNQNPYFQASVDSAIAPLLKTYENTILPNIRSQAVGVGQVGGSSEGIAQGQAVDSLLSQIKNIVADLGSNAYNTGQNAIIGALGNIPNLLNLNLAPSQVLQDVGGQRQALAQQEAQAPFSFLDVIKNLVGTPTVLGESTATGVTRGGSTSESQSVSESISKAISQAISDAFSRSQQTSTGTSLGSGSSQGGLIPRLSIGL